MAEASRKQEALTELLAVALPQELLARYMEDYGEAFRTPGLWQLEEREGEVRARLAGADHLQVRVTGKELSFPSEGDSVGLRPDPIALAAGERMEDNASTYYSELALWFGALALLQEEGYSSWEVSPMGKRFFQRKPPLQALYRIQGLELPEKSKAFVVFKEVARLNAKPFRGRKLKELLQGYSQTPSFATLHQALIAPNVELMKREALKTLGLA